MTSAPSALPPQTLMPKMVFARLRAFGSGDAAEAIPMRVVAGWEREAAKIGFEAALRDPQNLTREQYETLHDSGTAPGLHDPADGFVIEAIGTNTNPSLSDEGIEYYRYLS